MAAQCPASQATWNAKPLVTRMRCALRQKLRKQICVHISFNFNQLLNNGFVRELMVVAIAALASLMVGFRS